VSLVGLVVVVCSVKAGANQTTPDQGGRLCRLVGLLRVPGWPLAAAIMSRRALRCHRRGRPDAASGPVVLGPLCRVGYTNWLSKSREVYAGRKLSGDE